MSKLKTTILSLTVAAFFACGLTACDKGTRPGETNVERSDIKDAGEMIGEEGDQDTRYEDTDSLEKYYDHADHENHSDNDREALGDGAYDGKGDGIERGELDQ
ncbi:hypothetical protein [Pontibacter actiniarum]|uniref:Lipoprotein n=1 Tax=Pontibacter actiniarum TaxID=323450 RepID=A0A1X9YX83_9BACT|nr:hypothetical protein [Pontibacter actiniarum]ARS37364.1 hypothetical protein CA264_19140 [Pontibacter actiniarum]